MIAHHLDQDNERARQIDEEWRMALFVREHEHRFAFCRWMIAHGRLTDSPIDENTTFYRVTTHPMQQEDESWER